MDVCARPWLHLRFVLRCLTCLLVGLAGGALPALDSDEAHHLLLRCGFAPTPDEIAPYLPLSRQQAVDALLEHARSVALVPPPAWCQETLAEHASARQQESKAWEELSAEERRAHYQERETRDRQRGLELKAWWYQEMIATDSPLSERMVLFWHNHFTSALATVGDPLLMYEQNRLLREHALGNFSALLRSMPQDPAMYIYLDSNSNVQDRPNENFAREVMELFSVGEGYYSEFDIKEAARSLSGYKIDPASGRPGLDERYHDPGRKQVLGSSGVFDADNVMSLLLARQERVAIHISEKLWREFISEDIASPASSKAIYALAATFYHAHYDLPTVLRATLLEDAFWDPAQRGTLIRSPVELVVGTVRVLDLPVPDAQALVGIGRMLGEDLFDPPNVKGWRGGSAWISTQSMLARHQVLSQIAGGSLGAVHDRSARAAAPAAVPAVNGGVGDSMMATAAPHCAGPPQDHGGYLEQARHDPDGGAHALGLALLPLPPLTPLPVHGPISSVINAILTDPVYNLK